MHLPSIATTLAVLALAYCFTVVHRFIRNILIARKVGLPWLLVPWDNTNIFWMVISVPLKPLLQKCLPTAIYKRLALTIYGWEYHERMAPFRLCSGPHGNTKSFMMVTCGKLEFVTYDNELAYDILRRPREFPQIEGIDTFTKQFGPSVLASNGDDWARQRKVVASVINERISQAVFHESLRQTEGLLHGMFRESIHGRSFAETRELFSGIKKISMHVLSGTSMGLSVEWSDKANQTPRPGFKTTYLQATNSLVDGLAGPVILPQWFLSIYPSFLPGHTTLTDLRHALREFPVHRDAMLAEERRRSAASKGTQSRNNIMSQLLHAAEQGSDPDSKSKVLSEEEIAGNLFLFTSAGFETTANTMTYGIVLLARYQEWQDWIIEEIDQTVDASIANEQLEYNAIFPQLTRTLALMLETLRFYPPLVHLPKRTLTEQVITTPQGTHVLPANTTCIIDAVAIGLDPDVYRNMNLGPDEAPSDDDETRFRPTRWINPPGSPQPIYQPPKGSFLPWSTGPRVCPGMKMAQVEFCAVMLALLREHRIEVVPLPGESKSEVEKRLDAVIWDSGSVPTLQPEGVYDVKPPGGLPMRLTKRKMGRE